jgi:carbamoyl-phosphate synthase large subunit
MNVQYAIKDGMVYVLEVNPRASRTIPYVSKATGVPLARLAARVMAGEKLADLGVPEEPAVPGFAVKEAVFPFNRFDVDIGAGPGDALHRRGHGVRRHLRHGLRQGAGLGLESPSHGGDRGRHGPRSGQGHGDAPHPAAAGRRASDILGTRGTAEHLRDAGIPCERIFKVGEGRPDIVDRITTGDVQLLVNTPLGSKALYDEYAMRRAAITYKVPYLTTMSATAAATEAVEAMASDRQHVMSLQERVVPMGSIAAAD